MIEIILFIVVGNLLVNFIIYNFLKDSISDLVSMIRTLNSEIHQLRIDINSNSKDIRKDILILYEDLPKLIKKEDSDKS